MDGGSQICDGPTSRQPAGPPNVEKMAARAPQVRDCSHFTRMYVKGCSHIQQTRFLKNSTFKLCWRQPAPLEDKGNS